MASNIMLTAEPNGETLHRLEMGLKECFKAKKAPWLILDFSSILKIRDMVDACRAQIQVSSEAPINLVFDMTNLQEIGTWDHCLAELFSTRVFGASEQLPKTWNVTLLLPPYEGENLPACSTLATAIVDGSKPFDVRKLLMTPPLPNRESISEQPPSP